MLTATPGHVKVSFPAVRLFCFEARSERGSDPVRIASPRGRTVFYLPDGRSLDTNGCFGGIQNPIFRTLFLSTTTSVTPPVHMSFSTIEDDTQATRISRTPCHESHVIVIIVLDAFGG